MKPKAKANFAQKSKIKVPRPFSACYNNRGDVAGGARAGLLKLQRAISGLDAPESRRRRENREVFSLAENLKIQPKAQGPEQPKNNLWLLS